jgi:hypothetical protein
MLLLMHFQLIFFYQNLDHQSKNCPYQPNRVLLTQTISIDYKPYPIATHIQSLILNVQILIYPLALLNVSCKEPFIH